MKIIKNIGIFTFFILGILISQNSFCQKNCLPGYIVNLDGDTLQGFIDYRNWEKNPEKIFFQKEIDDEKIVFTPTDIKLFNVKDEVYVSAIVKTEISPFNLDALNFDPELKFKLDTTFLQTLIQGEKSLYYYNTNKGKENFYIKQGNKFDLLIYKKYFKYVRGGKYMAENKTYIGQLSLYLKDCPSIQSKFKNTKYSKKSLEQLFSFYYACTQSGIKFQKKTEKILIEIGVLAGFSVSSLKFKSSSFAYLVNVDYPNSTNFTTALFFDAILPRNQGKWSIYNELIFTSYKVKGSYRDFVNSNHLTIYDTKIGYSYLNIKNMLRYKFPIGKTILFVNVGMSNGFALSETNYCIRTSRFYADHKVTKGKALSSSRKYEQGIVFGLGTNLKKISFEIRYEMGNGMSEYSALRSTTKKYFFLFGYRF